MTEASWDSASGRDPLTYTIIGCAITVHRTLGLGLLESVYEECLCHELRKAGLGISRQLPLPVIYENLTFPRVYKPDLIINGEVVVEIKTVAKLLPVHQDQLLTYLRLSGVERGLLINFHARHLTKGVKRVILTQRAQRK